MLIEHSGIIITIAYAIYSKLKELVYNLFWKNNMDSNTNNHNQSDGGVKKERKKVHPKQNVKTANGLEIYKFRPYVVTQVAHPTLSATTRPTIYGPTPRSGHRIVCTSSKLWVLGGYNPRVSSRNGTRTIRMQSGMLFRELWVYDFILNRWKLALDQEAPDMPAELASNALIRYKNIILAYGGTGYPFGEWCSNSTYIFSTERPLVKRIEPNDASSMPVPQYGPAVVVHDKHLYTIGGTTGFDYSCDVYRLNLENKVWEMMYICRPELDRDPQGRYRHEVAYDGRYVYVLGGGTSLTSFPLDKIPAYDLEKNTFDYVMTKPDPLLSESSGYPKARRSFSLVQYEIDDTVEAVILGGVGELDVTFDDIWKINLKTLQWKLLQSAAFPRPIYFHAAATPGNGCMYTFGGIEVKNNNLVRTNNMYRIWTTIPKLSEICWDAISYYSDTLSNYSKSDLLRMGIPEKFVDRVPTISTGIRDGNTPSKRSRSQ